MIHICGSKLLREIQTRCNRHSNLHPVSATVGILSGLAILHCIGQFIGTNVYDIFHDGNVNGAINTSCIRTQSPGVVRIN